MDGIIQRYWEPIRTELPRCVDKGRVAHDMESGGCLDKWFMAVVACDNRSHIQTTFDRKPGEAVVPVDLDTCIKATAALRQCMQGNPDVFREHIAAMEEGIAEEQKRQREAEADPRFSWWIGLRNS